MICKVPSNHSNHSMILWLSQTQLKLLACHPCKQKGRAAVEKSGLAKSWMNRSQRSIFPQAKQAVGELTRPREHCSRAPMLLTGVDVPFLPARLFEFSLGTSGRLQSSGTRASTRLSVCTYLHWWALHKNKVLDAAVVTVRCTLLSSEREPRKMVRGALVAPFSSSPSTCWKFATGNKKKW